MPERAAVEIGPLRDAVRAQEKRHIRIADPRWPSGAKIAVNVTLDFDAMLLRRLLNEPPMQLAKGEFGGRVGIWRLLELFEAHAIKSTIFTPGRICELYPDSIVAAAKAGHEIADHMWEHRVPPEADIERAHLMRACEAIERLAGRLPQGTRSAHTPELLHELGMIYKSRPSSYDRPHIELNKRGSLMSLPFHYAIDDAMYFNFTWLNSENASQRVTDTDRVHDLWWSTFLHEYSTGSGYLNIVLHPFVSGRSLRIAMLDRLITSMKAMPGVWFATSEEIARHCIALEAPKEGA